jgi:hypothetical protein
MVQKLPSVALHLERAIKAVFDEHVARAYDKAYAQFVPILTTEGVSAFLGTLNARLPVVSRSQDNLQFIAGPALPPSPVSLQAGVQQPHEQSAAFVPILKKPKAPPKPGRSAITMLMQGDEDFAEFMVSLAETRPMDPQPPNGQLSHETRDELVRVLTKPSTPPVVPSPPIDADARSQTMTPDGVLSSNTKGRPRHPKRATLAGKEGALSVSVAKSGGATMGPARCVTFASPLVVEVTVTRDPVPEAARSQIPSAANTASTTSVPAAQMPIVAARNIPHRSKSAAPPKPARPSHVLLESPVIGVEEVPTEASQAPPDAEAPPRRPSHGGGHPALGALANAINKRQSTISKFAAPFKKEEAGPAPDDSQGELKAQSPPTKPRLDFTKFLSGTEDVHVLASNAAPNTTSPSGGTKGSPSQEASGTCACAALSSCEFYVFDVKHD